MIYQIHSELTSLQKLSMQLPSKKKNENWTEFKRMNRLFAKLGLFSLVKTMPKTLTQTNTFLFIFRFKTRVLLLLWEQRTGSSRDQETNDVIHTSLRTVVYKQPVLQDTQLQREGGRPKWLLRTEWRYGGWFSFGSCSVYTLYLFCSQWLAIRQLRHWVELVPHGCPSHPLKPCFTEQMVPSLISSYLSLQLHLKEESRF